MKKIAVITLLFTLVFSQSGYHLYTFIAQQILKEKMEREILAMTGNEHLIAVSLTAEITWEEKGHEFSLNGEMYDVVRADTVAGKITLYCVNDKKEQELVENRNQLLKNTAPVKKTKAENPTVLFCESFPDKISAANLLADHFNESRDNVLQRNTPVISPPPES